MSSVKPISVVIVRNNKGYIASLRFNDSSYDRDIAAHSRYVIGLMIDDYILRPDKEF